MRLGLGCGCLSIIVAIASLFLFLVIPSVVTDNTTINELMGRIFCGDADAYLNQSTSSSYRPGETSYYLVGKCQKPDNVVEDVSNQQALAGFGVFFIGLFGGIFLIIASSVRRAAKTVQSMITVNGVPLTNLSEMVNQRPIIISTSTMSSGNLTGKPDEGETLAEKLRQLEESYEARLINKEEYDDARKRLLDNL